MEALARLPTYARQVAAEVGLRLLVARSLKHHYRAALHNSDVVVIGGGNLLADNDLNFPIKIESALQCVKRLRIPVAVYGCGVGARWSPRGSTLFRRALANATVKGVFVRDEMSRTRWNDRMIEVVVPKCEVVRDPGLLASHVYNVVRERHGEPRVGVGVISPGEIRYHSDAHLSDQEVGRWYLEMVKRLISSGLDIVTFANGCPDDVVFLNELMPEMKRVHGSSVRVEDVRSPTDLLRVVKQVDALVAFRMHAAIAAYSVGIPIVALEWDEKVTEFMRSIDERNHVVNIAMTSPEQASSMVIDSMHRGIRSEKRDQVIEDAWLGVRRLCACLGLGNRRPAPMPTGWDGRYPLGD